MRNKSSNVTDPENVPNVIKKKLEKHKTEGRLVNKKDLFLGQHVSVKSTENIGNRKIKVTVEILNFAGLENRPEIPRYGELISEVFQITVADAKGIEMQKKGNICCTIKSPEIDKFCYPLLFSDLGWRMAEYFAIESDSVSITDGNWSIVLLIKEPPNEIITINPTGGMIYSELDKVTCLRVPKGIFRESVSCKIQFVHMSMDNLSDFQSVYDDQLMTFIQISQIFVVQLVDHNRDLIIDENMLRRAVSMKIPLPDWVMSHLNDINFDTKKTVQDQRKEKLGFYLLQKIGNAWNFFDGNMKFTQTSLGIDTKYFGSFVFVKCRENREIRLCTQMNLVEHLQLSVRGVILVFLWIKRHKWFLWIEIVPVNQIKMVREELESNGLIFIDQNHDSLVENPMTENGRRNNRKLSKKDIFARRSIDLYKDIQFKLSITGDVEADEDPLQQKPKIPKDLENNLKDNDKEPNDFSDFDRIGKKKVTIIEPNDDVQEIVKPDLSFHRYSRQSNAIIVPIKPKDSPVTQWTKIITDNLKKRSIYESSGLKKQEVIKVPINDSFQTDIDRTLLKASSHDQVNESNFSDQEKQFSFHCDICLEILNCQIDLISIPPQRFTFYIPIDIIKDYFNVLTEDEIQALEMERIKLENEQIMHEKERELESLVINEPNKPKTVNYSRIDKLSNPRTKNINIIRDPKVISSKSMLALASVVRQGLTLAVYLSLPENVIAGIGFDSLSQMSINGVNNTTYKVLVTWKKMIHLNKVPETDYIEQLSYALRMLGYDNLTNLIDDHWKHNKDLSIDDCQRCLLKRCDVL